jgi:hypothetical protein
MKQPTAFFLLALAIALPVHAQLLPGAAAAPPIKRSTVLLLSSTTTLSCRAN